MADITDIKATAQSDTYPCTGLYRGNSLPRTPHPNRTTACGKEKVPNLPETEWNCRKGALSNKTNRPLYAKPYGIDGV